MQVNTTSNETCFYYSIIGDCQDTSPSLMAEETPFSVSTIVESLIELGYSKQTIAKTIGVAYSTLNKWLEGKVVKPREEYHLRLIRLYSGAIFK